MTRLEELAEESGMTQYVAANNKFLERFAQLIVADCLENIEQFDHHITPAMDVVPTMVAGIKESFGVPNGLR